MTLGISFDELEDHVEQFSHCIDLCFVLVAAIDLIEKVFVIDIDFKEKLMLGHASDKKDEVADVDLIAIDLGIEL